MQLYLWPPNVPSLLSGGNRLSSLQPVYAWERANIQAWILTFIARGLQSLQQIKRRVKHSFLRFPPNLFFFSPLVFSTEPSRGPLQGPQACPEAQSHGGAEEQAAASRGGLVHGEGARPRQRPGTRPGPEQDVRTRGGSPRAHGHELSGGNKYVNRHRDGKKAALDDHSIVLCFL